MSFNGFVVFFVTSSTSAKRFPLKKNFHFGGAKKKKVVGSKIRQIGRVEKWSHAILDQKLSHSLYFVGE